MSFDIWKMLAGLAIFLLGMRFLEEGLHRLAGRSFKLFLRKQTSGTIKGIAGGAVVTAVLQSSSIVNLLVLAFAGAGVIQMQNALAISMGANLGTTFSSWIVATIGFKFNIASFALPIAGISGITLMLSNKEGKLYQWCKLLLGFGFLFMGLDYIKTGIEGYVQQADLGALNAQPPVVFLLIGLLITSLVQSSSATVAIVLSALYANAIDLLSAMAIVLGAEIGTTIKLMIASVNGIAIKKRIALGNLLFNLINTMIIFIFLYPIHRVITHFAGTNDELMALVFFQSLVNVIGIILFYPFLNVVSKFLNKQFTHNKDEDLLLLKMPLTDTDLALETLKKQTRHFIFLSLHFAKTAFKAGGEEDEKMFSKTFLKKPLKEKYDHIKTIHGEIHQFSIRLQNAASLKKDLERTDQVIACARNCMYAAKSIRDALQDIEQLQNSSNDTKYNFYLATREKVIRFASQIQKLMEQQDTEKSFEALTRIFKETQQGYTVSIQELYKEGVAKSVNQVEISTLINFNREMYTAFKSFLFAIKDHLLTPDKAGYFEDLPGFIR